MECLVVGLWNGHDYPKFYHFNYRFMADRIVRQTNGGISFECVDDSVS
jgi:hypothetical protein